MGIWAARPFVIPYGAQLICLHVAGCDTKPVNYYQFCTKLSRAVQRVQRRRGGQVVLQLAGGGMQVLSTGDIYYLETHDRLLWYHTRCV